MTGPTELLTAGNELQQYQLIPTVGHVRHLGQMLADGGQHSSMCIPTSLLLFGKKHARGQKRKEKQNGLLESTEWHVISESPMKVPL